MTIRRKDHEPFRAYLGGIFLLSKITLTFTKVPLEGKVGLSEGDQLVLLVGDVKYLGSRGEPAFHMDIVDKNGIHRRGEFITPAEDPTIGRWVKGLQTGNG